MNHVRVKDFQRGLAPIRIKNFISAPTEQLRFLDERLGGIDKDSYTWEKSKETEGYGDCCSMSVIEWGHARKTLYEDMNRFEDEDRRGYVGEYFFNVNEMVMLADQEILNLTESDKDSHRPLIVHLILSDMTDNEANTFRSEESKFAKAQRRRERRAANKKRDRPKEEEYDDIDEDAPPVWRDQHWNNSRWHGRWNQWSSYGGLSSSRYRGDYWHSG